MKFRNVCKIVKVSANSNMLKISKQINNILIKKQMSQKSLLKFGTILWENCNI